LICVAISSDVEPHSSVGNTSTEDQYLPELFISCVSLSWNDEWLKFFDWFNIWHCGSSIFIKINSSDHEASSFSSVRELCYYGKLFWPGGSIRIKHRNIILAIFCMWISSIQNTFYNCLFLVFIVVKFMEILWHPSSVDKETTCVLFLV